MSQHDLAHTARELIRLRAQLQVEEAEAELADLRTNKANDDAETPAPSQITKAAELETETITMPLEEIVNRFELVAKAS